MRGTFGQAIFTTPQCPDCDSEVREVEVAPNVRVTQVLHDPTCPWLHTREATG